MEFPESVATARFVLDLIPEEAEREEGIPDVSCLTGGEYQ